MTWKFDRCKLFATFVNHRISVNECTENVIPFSLVIAHILQLCVLLREVVVMEVYQGSQASLFRIHIKLHALA